MEFEEREWIKRLVDERIAAHVIGVSHLDFDHEHPHDHPHDHPEYVTREVVADIVVDEIEVVAEETPAEVTEEVAPAREEPDDEVTPQRPHLLHRKLTG